MISDLFITRTRLAIVISIVISIAGAIAIFSLPVQQYPQITPPTVTVSATYPGASAEVIADVVGGPLETAINGVDNMMYMSSTSSNAGQYSLSVTFEVGTDPDIAQVNVQNRAQLAISQLPAAVSQQGVSVRSRSPDFVLGIAFYSPDDKLDALEITNFASTTIVDAISRVAGVGEASVVGASEYSMRVWLNPTRMDALGITADDVAAQSSSRISRPRSARPARQPAQEGTELQYTLVAQGRLIERGRIRRHRRAHRRGRRDRAAARRRPHRTRRPELFLKRAASAGTRRRCCRSTRRRAPTPSRPPMRCWPSSQRLSPTFPPGLEYQVVYDATRFVRASLSLIVQILGEAFLIVLAVTFLFLQDWRATLVSALAIPVSMLGAMAVLLAFGYSINTISLLALVLAIGLVVDDAILVVENVKHVMEDDPGYRHGERHAQGDGADHGADHLDDAGAARRGDADGVPVRHQRPALPPVRRHVVGRAGSLVHRRR